MAMGETLGIRIFIVWMPKISGVLSDLGSGQIERVVSGLDARFNAIQQFGARVPAGSAPLQHLTAVRGRHGGGFEQIGGTAVAATLGSVSPLLLKRAWRRVQGAALADPAVLRRGR